MSGPDLELEERLHRLAPAFKDGIAAPATLHGTVMAATTAPRPPARRSMLRELSLAAALIVFVALLAFGFSRLHALAPAPVKPNPTPNATTPNVIPWMPTTMVVPSPWAQRASPAEAAIWIRHTVSAVDPLLVPAAIGDDYTAQFVVDPNSFVIDYANTVRHATVELRTLPVMPNQGANVQTTIRTFRGVRATYHVDRPGLTAPRWLLWTETSANHSTVYSLTTAGLADTEFWQVADSLKPLTVDTGVRPCVAADLDGAAGQGNGASGQSYNTVLLTNHSASSCLLEGTPQVLLRTSAGRTLPLPQVSMSQPWRHTPPGPVLMTPFSPHPQPGTGLGMNWGQATFVYSMWDCPANPPYSSVSVTLPNQRGTVTIPAFGGGYSGGGECQGTAVQRMEVGPFVGTEPPPVAADKTPLSITLDLPDHVRAGQTLRYQVTLTNASGAPFHFHDCPSYVEDASRPGHKILASYQLNCSSVGWLALNESVTFAMVLEIPADTPPGPGRLRWEMLSSYGNGEAVGTVTVTEP